MSETVEAPTAPKKRMGTGAVIGLVMAVGLAGGIGAGFIPEEKKPDHPDQWDPRVISLVQYAEHDRGLTFKHPVFVDFLTDAEFTKQVTTSDGDLSADDKKDIANFEGQMRALGIISSKVDLLKEMNSLQGSGVIGLYSYGDHRIRVRGEKLTPAVKITLVHELTHVLQDQNFDTGAVEKRLSKSDTEDASALQALLEGDARRIETDYRGTLSSQERAEADKEESAGSDKFEKEVADVPEFMQATFQAPYPLGNALVNAAFANGGNKGVDALLKNPPINDRVILNPQEIGVTRHVAGLPDLKLTDAQKETERGIFGTTTLFFMLARSHPAPAAIDLAGDDWEDRYVAYTEKDKTCIKAAFGAAPGRAQTLRDGLSVWAKQAKTGATVVLAGDIVTLTACDPGANYTPPADHSLAALHVLVERNYAYADVRKEGIRPAVASCFADGIIHIFSEADLTRLDSSSEPPAADQQKISELIMSCRKA